MEPSIIANRIQTPDGTILQSFNRHDFKSHVDKVTGKMYGVDGGCEYLRRIGSVNDCKDLSVYSTDPHELIREAMHWGTRGKEGTAPLRYIALKDMDPDHIKACLDTQPRMHPHFRKAMETELEYRDESSAYSIAD